MKRVFIILLFLSCSSYGFGQSVRPLNDKSVVHILGNIDSAFFRKGKGMVISLYRINNGPGSAKLPESDEVSYNLIISVSEYGEYPDNKVFSIGPFISPQILNEKDVGKEYLIEIRHGIYNRRKSNKLIITSSQVLLR